VARKGSLFVFLWSFWISASTRGGLFIAFLAPLSEEEQERKKERKKRKYKKETRERGVSLRKSRLGVCVDGEKGNEDAAYTKKTCVFCVVCVYGE